MDIDYYTLKANVSTFLVTGILPILVTLGVAENTANIIITVLTYLIVLGVCLYSERYTSDFLTKAKSEEVDEVGSESDSETA